MWARAKKEVAMFDLKTVLLPVDFSARSLEAARQVKGIARRFRCRLVVLNVVEQRRTELQFEPGGSSVEELQSYLCREMRERPVEYILEPGDPAQIIHQVARDYRANLIVLAGHNRKPFEDFALGSVTAEVLDSAPCPVLVSLWEERGPAPLFRKILCPVGLSDSTDVTLDWALQFAHAFHAECDVIHVAAKSDGQEQGYITEEWLTNAERGWLDAVKKKLDGCGKVILASGEIGKAVAAASADLRSDLLVMGHSRPGNEIGRVHSLPFILAHRAPCPVVVV